MVSQANPGVDCYEGEWRRPYNDLQHQEVGGGHKSIHDTATAAKAGFTDGAPIHGTVHFSQFTPLLLKVYGHEWFERGTISVAFKNPVSHLQPVKAFIERRKGEKRPKQVQIWMEHLDGRLVFDGTASLGEDDGNTKVDQQLKRIKPLEGQLVFIPHEIGTRTLGVEQAKLEFGKVIGDLFPFTPEQKLEVITEWHPWFGIASRHPTKSEQILSPWGDDRPIVPPEALNQIMLYTMPNSYWPTPSYDVMPKGKTPVGLFGGCGIKLHNGPVFMNESYQIKRELIAKGETPRTEFRWIRTTLTDVSDNVVAEMILQDMMLKSTIEKYQLLRTEANKMCISKL